MNPTHTRAEQITASYFLFGAKVKKKKKEIKEWIKERTLTRKQMKDIVLDAVRSSDSSRNTRFNFGVYIFCVHFYQDVVDVEAGIINLWRISL